MRRLGVLLLLVLAGCADPPASSVLMCSGSETSGPCAPCIMPAPGELVPDCMRADQ